MADEALKIDANDKPVVSFVTDDSNQYIKMGRIDDTTKGLKVMIVGGTGSGTVTDFIFTNANGITGSVATSTTTPTLTLDVSALNASKIADGSVSNTEFQYLDGVSSNIQTQLNAKGAGTVTSVSVTTANGISGSVATATTTPAITLTLGAITPTTVNGLTITSSTGTLTITNGKTLSVSNILTFTGTDSSSVAFGTGGTVAYTANKLSVFTATTSAELAGVISDETGTGSLVFANKPTFLGTIQTITAMGAQAVDGSLGNIFTRTLAGSEVFTQSNFSTGQCFMVEVKQGSGTSYTVTWFSGITWVTSGGTAPTQTTTSNGFTTYGLRCTGSNTFLGYLVGTN